MLGLEMGEEVDGYDCVVSDGVHKIKCVLSPQFNPLVRDGTLRQGSIIQVG
jgi:hypothetical protein